MKTVTLPAWMFDRIGQHFLVVLPPDGEASIDGDHSDPQGVAKAKVLHERIGIIRPPTGSRYVMVTLSEVPAHTGRINGEAVGILNSLRTYSDLPIGGET